MEALKRRNRTLRNRKTKLSRRRAHVARARVGSVPSEGVRWRRGKLHLGSRKEKRTLEDARFLGKKAISHGQCSDFAGTAENRRGISSLLFRGLKVECPLGFFFFFHLSLSLFYNSHSLEFRYVSSNEAAESRCTGGNGCVTTFLRLNTAMEAESRRSRGNTGSTGCLCHICGTLGELLNYARFRLSSEIFTFEVSAW
ncbi:hypothetical protein KFK09_024447 [Dendrobium nobile]|uniref:Uncharacterized protein n=1 Tax=Dendrobium nobile TaxID=94219 RepID=A0A8T3AJC6_DENNO|nr:hypothetical protein KFK09_024447 [Dendrobium nobile]